MRFERSTDLRLVRAILTDPDIYDRMGDDGIPPREEYQVPNHPGIWWITVWDRERLLGLFAFFPENAICWATHVALFRGIHPRLTAQAGPRRRPRCRREAPVGVTRRCRCGGGRGNSATDDPSSGAEGRRYSIARLRQDLDVELLDYFSTCLPALLDGLTPAAAAANRARFGFLTCESDGRVAAWACCRAVLALRRAQLQAGVAAVAAGS